MKKLIVVTILTILLAGCSVEDVPPEAYTATAKGCQAQGKVMEIYKSPNTITLQCVDP